METVRTAIIGCGKVAQIHATALRDLPESQLVGVCDSDPARAGDFAGKYQTEAYADLGLLLKHAKPQVVCVCTPHPQHAVAVVQAAQAGVSALVEKPLAANLADCDAMLAASHS